MNETVRYTRVEFRQFKAFSRFRFDLKNFNVLVGPNNAGKSTIVAAFRILATAVKKARSRKAKPFHGPSGLTQAHEIDLTSISVAAENIFHNYDGDDGAEITFHLSNGNLLRLYFPDIGRCYLIAERDGSPVASPSSFKKHFNAQIGFVPILGPVEHDERLYGAETAQRALHNFEAARHFRNIWHYYPEKFDEFKSKIIETWPGMDIEKPASTLVEGKPVLHMFSPENRIPRELYWAGFGFQVWCQMLTYIVQSEGDSIFLIDEPDIYLHSDLQRQLVTLLRNLGPDILIATHSTEIISEADTDEIVVIDKSTATSRRLRNPSQIGKVFNMLGSNTNPILTQLAKTRRVLFVEGKDYQILGKFARKLRFTQLANRSGFAVVPLEGFRPEKMRNMIEGIETTLGAKIATAAILDGDYRCAEQKRNIVRECSKFCGEVRILDRKEIENYVVLPAAIDRAVTKRLKDKATRGTGANGAAPSALKLVEDFADETKISNMALYIAEYSAFKKAIGFSKSPASLNEEAMAAFEETWRTEDSRFGAIAGKDCLSNLNQNLQSACGVSVTPTAIIDAMKRDEVPTEIVDHLSMLQDFSKRTVD